MLLKAPLLGLVKYIYSVSSFNYKGWFPYDRGSQIADRNKVCDHMETTSVIVCDAEDRTMFYLKAGFHMIADDRRPYCDLRSAIIWKPALNAS